MDEFHLFSDLPEPLRAAIFLAAWRDKRGWPTAAARHALRLVCRQARAAVDTAVESLKLEGLAEVEAFVCSGSEFQRWPALRELTADWEPDQSDTAISLALAQLIPPRLQELCLCGTPMDERTAAALAVAGTGLSALRIDQTFVNDDSLNALFQTAWHSLHRLELLSIRLTSHGAAVLAAAANALRLPALRHLDLSFNFLDNAGVQALMSAAWPRLEELNLSGTRFGAEGAAALGAAAAAGHLPALRTLNLNGNYLSGVGLQALLTTPWHRLERLDLRFIILNAAGMEALAAASHTSLPRLRALLLGSNPGFGAGVQSLVQGVWSRLEELHLDGAGMGPMEAAVLGAASSRFPALQQLVLSSNDIGDAGVQGLVQGPWHCLQSLNMKRTGIGPDGAATLAAAAAACLPALQHLDLRENDLKDAGVRALAQVAWPALKQLWLHSTDVGRGGVEALAAAGAARFPALRSLRLWCVHVSEAQAAALRAAWPGGMSLE